MTFSGERRAVPDFETPAGEDVAYGEDLRRGRPAIKGLGKAGRRLSQTGDKP